MDLQSSATITQRNNLPTATARYEDLPDVKPLSRSRYKVPFRNTGTCNASVLVPFYYKYVMPNMTDSIETSFVIRMQPTVHSPMSNLYADLYYFFIAGKDLWVDDGNGSLKEFFGEQKGMYTPKPLSTYQIPQVTIPSGGFSFKSVADYLGIPPGVDPGNGFSVSALPFRAYGLVWNNFFRSEDLSPEALVYTGSSTQTGQQIAFDPLNTAALGGDLLPVCRPHDLFGGALPYPFKGDPADAAIPFNGVGRLPVQTFNGEVPRSNLNIDFPMLWRTADGSNSGLGQDLYIYGTAGADKSFTARSKTDTSLSSTGTPWVPQNLFAEFKGATGYMATISDLRRSIALQHYFEALNRGGSRYYEVISNLYGTSVDPLALDRPIYLGGKRVPISITNVVQNTPTGSGTDGLGSVAGYSCTSDFNDKTWTFSFDEHGVVLGCFCIRSEKQYQESLDRNWRLKDRIDFYTPGVFDGLSEINVLNSDIYLTSNDSTGVNNQTFGFQEAYYWERYRPFVTSGEFRSSYSTPLDSWHLADTYTQLPVLGGLLQPNAGGTALERGWIYDNTDDMLDRVLQVSRSQSDQFYFDIYVDDTVVSPLPVYSIPGINTI